MRDILTALGFRVDWSPPALYSVYPPFWRPDVRIPDDVAEELIRIHGYDDLPLTTVKGRLPEPLPQPLRDLRERAKDLLAAAGMQEVYTYSLTSMEQLRRVIPTEDLAVAPPLRLANPLSSEREYVRTTLRAGLLETLARNLRVRRTEVALFEAARVYLPREGDLPDERETVVAVLAGRRSDRWGQPTGESVDFFDAKGYVEALAEGLHIELGWRPVTEFGLLPGRTAEIRLGSEAVGLLGQVHPDLAGQYDIAGDAFLFELDLSKLLGHAAPVRNYQPYVSYPAVEQDLALVVDEETAAADVLKLVREGRWVVAARVFDEYRGDRLPAGKKSLTIALSFQAPDRTLTDEDVAGARRRLVATLERRLAAALRS